ncbi:MAG TPA: hypothetical protein VFN37_09010 [Candidatus Baltobacteraceae bacterium]|nr:hypothetical protein [Candidatus Baltobacteraceae bacterium]
MLVSFSSAPEQRSLEKVQRTLDAIEKLPVNAIVTTAGIVDTEELDIPANAVAVRYAAARSTAILSTPSYKETSRRLSTLLVRRDGAANAADEVESRLLTRVLPQGRNQVGDFGSRVTQ